ncbi:MAG: PEGA domain-containing protein [Candidatus Dojkabacteria bacterium]|nr:MAG: PEGA domain-containing protein [Candidatus Dojkabacteria bacterium]
MKKQFRTKILPVITSIFGALIIISGTLIVFLYANGYRFNREEGTLDKTGVISISASPYRSEIYLDGKPIGRTPKTVSSLKAGVHTVRITNDGFHDWYKEVDVKVEKSTPISAILLRSELKAEEVFKVDDEIVNVSHDQLYNYVFITTKKELTTSPTPTAPLAQDQALYKIWRYNINPNFWELAQNPVLIYEEEIAAVEEFELLVSPNGQKALLTLTTPVAGPEEQTKAYSLLNTGSKNDTPTPLNLEAFTEGYEIEWAMDSQFLMLQSDTELVTLNTRDETKYIIRRDNLPAAWSTNTDGHLYLIDEVSEAAEDEQVQQSKFQIARSSMEGNDSTVFIDDIFTLPESEILVEQFQDPVTKSELQTPFEVSEVGDKLAGDITGILEMEDFPGFVIFTTLSTYFYDPEDNRYTLMLPEAATVVGSDSGNTELGLYGTTVTAVYTYDKEEADHTVEIGTLVLTHHSEGSKNEQFRWVPSTDYLSTLVDSSLYVIDDEGDNYLKILDDKAALDFYMINRSGEYLYTFAPESDSEGESGSYSLVRYELR